MHDVQAGLNIADDHPVVGEKRIDTPSAGESTDEWLIIRRICAKLYKRTRRRQDLVNDQSCFEQRGIHAHPINDDIVIAGRRGRRRDVLT